MSTRRAQSWRGKEQNYNGEYLSNTYKILHFLINFIISDNCPIFLNYICVQGTKSQYIYFILKGQVLMMRKPENLYDKQTGKQFKPFNQLQCVLDPHQSGQESLGVQVGLMKGETLVCEDAGLFNLHLSYSVIAQSPDVLVYRIPTVEALENWPQECQNEIKLKVLEKYNWFYERLLTIESSLSDKNYIFQDKPYKGGFIRTIPNSVAQENARIIEAARKVDRHTTNNYPQATQYQYALQ